MRISSLAGVILAVSPMSVMAWLGALQEPTQWTTVLRGSMSRVQTAQQVVIRSDTEWQALWTAHGGSGSAVAIDFSTSMVVGVFLGSQRTAGFAVEITGVRVEDDMTVVEFVTDRPPPDAIVAQVLTAPFHLARVPRASGVVRFLGSSTPGRGGGVRPPRRRGP